MDHAAAHARAPVHKLLARGLASGLMLYAAADCHSEQVETGKTCIRRKREKKGKSENNRASTRIRKGERNSEKERLLKMNESGK